MAVANLIHASTFLSVQCCLWFQSGLNILLCCFRRRRYKPVASSNVPKPSSSINNKLSNGEALKHGRTDSFKRTSNNNNNVQSNKKTDISSNSLTKTSTNINTKKLVTNGNEKSQIAFGTKVPSSKSIKEVKKSAKLSNGKNLPTKKSKVPQLKYATDNDQNSAIR